MLQSLEICNYRNLRHLTIEKLGWVNLMVGKNNTGKTSVLEAVGILAKRGDISFLLELINHRGENYISSSQYNSGRGNEIVRSISTLFTDREMTFNRHDPLTVTGVEHDGHSEIRIALRLIRYLNEREQYDDEPLTVKKRVLVDEYYNEDEVEVGLEAKYNKATIIHSLNAFWRSNGRVVFGGPFVNFDFVRTNSLYRDANGSLWDSVTLTERERYVLQSLKLIEDDIDALTFVNSDVSEVTERIATVRLKSTNQKLPLRSMGDGINRILTIILAMVNCENGYLLIDEFENGLHYSVQEKLWEVIFYLAEKLNIQVFATTHSNDTIKAFGEVANSKPEYNNAQLIQLRNVKGEISAVLYSTDDVEIAIETEYLDLR